VEISESLPLQPLWRINSGLSSPSRDRCRHNGDLGALLFQSSRCVSLCPSMQIRIRKKQGHISFWTFFGKLVSLFHMIWIVFRIILFRRPSRFVYTGARAWRNQEPTKPLVLAWKASYSPFALVTSRSEWSINNSKSCCKVQQIFFIMPKLNILFWASMQVNKLQGRKRKCRPSIRTSRNENFENRKEVELGCHGHIPYMLNDHPRKLILFKFHARSSCAI
jgi:hypothetical protein